MMNFTILLVLTFFFVGRYSEETNEQQINIKTISMYSAEHENIHNIKITPINIKKSKCDNREFLNLDRMCLRRWNDKNIIRSDAIRQISLQYNFLEKIPHNFLDHVTYLSCLNLSHNSINIYEGNKIRHPYLQVLDLSYQELQKTINTLVEVETFEEKTENMYKHNYKHKYMMFNTSNIRLPNLEYLDLSGNDISAILRDFNTSFPKLTRLDLVNINAEELEPDFFDKIPKSLRVLHLENNDFYNMTLRNITEITALYMDGNPFERLEIMSTNLRILSLSNCTNLSWGHFNTPHLEELDLSMNNLHNVFGVQFEMFRSLRTLLLDYNKLSYIPIFTNLQRLNQLSLRYNMIRFIKPNSFEHLISLTKLSLRGNQLESIEEETFLGLEKLEYLDLSENELSHLSSTWTLPLMNLRYLNLNTNYFTNISKLSIDTIYSLRYLFVRNNTFTKITTIDIESLPNFITIYLA